MAILIVVNNPNDWPLDIPGVDVVSARSYLIETQYSDMRGAKVFNLCRSYRYQSFGYYVSLLAAARGHKPLPSITTIQDLKLQTMIRLASDDLNDLIQSSLSRTHSGTFELSIYFGRNLAKKYDRLSLALFNLFPAPLLRAKFEYKPDGDGAGRSGSAGNIREDSGGAWELKTLQPIPASEVPPDHWLFVLYAANVYFIGRGPAKNKPQPVRYDLAILYNEQEESSPSNAGAIKKFVKAAKEVGFSPEVIGKDDYGRIAEFDALFIRETTSVNHYTYRFSRRAAAEGLVVIDDPVSIVRCTNKVYLAELLYRHEIKAPRTMIVHQGNMDEVPLWVGFPCVLKIPDSAFSKGVVKAVGPRDLREYLDSMLEKSDLVIAQEWLPSDFDWRVGVFNGKVLFTCKYHMVRGHWQIVGSENGEKQFGKVETMPVEAAPRRVVQIALKTANLIGNGLYGVDLKQVGGKVYVMEVNDNPNIDSGYEDRALKGELYRVIMQTMMDRVVASRTIAGGK
ncbi:MAG: RimK family protein [Phycisphaerales bacterium]|nr:RimK family protein [Phycisphaerales bacterium]